MSTLHAEKVPPHRASVATGRSRPVRHAPKPRRIAPPVACTTSNAVRYGALEPAEEIRDLAAADQATYQAMWQQTSDPAMREHIVTLARRSHRRTELATGAATFLHGPVEALARAEMLCDWDALADLTAYRSGREIAGELIPLLETIRAADGSPRFGEIAQAQAKLTAWFDAHGSGLIRPIVLREVGKATRAPTLLVEWERYQARQATS